jgi:hypothetical protein
VVFAGSTPFTLLQLPSGDTLRTIVYLRRPNALRSRRSRTHYVPSADDVANVARSSPWDVTPKNDADVEEAK